MNERIKELAKQATQQYSPTYYTQEWIQGFAQLIVRECADTVLGFHNQFGDNAHNEIREHFGVKE